MVYQKGQIALIALLVLTVATTVGLSLIARTTTDVSVTRNLEESNRAFSAAEAGIEETLKSGVASPETTIDTLGTKYDVTIASLNGTAGAPFVFPQKTPNEQTETVWLVNHNADGTLNETPTYTGGYIDICWSRETITPALVVSVLYKKASTGTYQIAKGAYDPDKAIRLNNFDTQTSMNGCQMRPSVNYDRRINFSSDFTPSIDPTNDILIALRIRPVYSATYIVISPTSQSTLPTQGKNIQSTGTAGNGTTREILVYQLYRAPDSIFDYAVYSQNLFSKP